MLVGILKYRDVELGEAVYNVKARDTFNDFKLHLTAYDPIMDMGKSSKMFDMDWEVSETEVDAEGNPKEIFVNKYPMVSDLTRRLDIKKTNKYKSNITNREMALKISALIRYVQIAGVEKKDNTSMEAEFSAYRYVTAYDTLGREIGVITYRMGLIHEIHCENSHVTLSLKPGDDSNIDESLFKELKEKDKWGRAMTPTPISNVGFKLSSDLLGFKYVPAVEKDDVVAFGMYENIEDVIAAHPDKNTDWILNRNYHIVTDENLQEVIKMFNNHEGLIAFDTETTGLKINFTSRDDENKNANHLVGCVLSKEVGEGYYFPLRHNKFPNLCGGDHHFFMERYMRPILEKKKIVAHNIKFDWKVAYIYDINVNCVYDTMLALGVTKRYEEASYELGLKSLARNIFGLDMFDLGDFVMGGSFGDSEITFADLPYELVRRYAPADTDMTLSLYEFIEKEDILNKYNAVEVFKMELTFAKAVAYSEFYGYHIDVERIEDLREKIEGSMDDCKGKMFELAGKEFNPNSPAQLLEIMYQDLGIEKVTEKASTDKSTLKILAGKENPDGSPKYPFVRILKEYRDNEGIYKNFLKKLHIFSTPDGYIFPDVLQLGTNTGRSSVKNPNYQSYNDVVKKYIVPRPGFIHMDSDFSQIEYRVLASMAQQEQLIEAFNDPDLDYHTYQAARMHNVPYAAVSKQLRQQSKGINFGLPYGMGDESLGAAIFGERSAENTIKAGELRKKFFAGQEKIQKFFDDGRAGGVKNGFTSTQFGRRRYYQRGVFTVNEIRRQAGNHIIQGSAADIYKLAICHLFERVCKEGWLGLVLFNAFVHDEILMEVHESINPYYFLKAWREEFQLKIEGYCNLYAGIGIGKCWYDAKKGDYPPQYIDEIINSYDEETNNNWDGDFDKLLKDIKAGYGVYNTRRVYDYILESLDENSKLNGDVIKPAVGALLADEVVTILGSVKGTELEQDYYSIEGVKVTDKGAETKNLQSQLQIFCKKHNIDYTKVNIISAEDVVIKPNNTNSDDEVYLAEDEVQIDITQAVINSVLGSCGYWVDYNNNILHIVEMLYRTTSGSEQATKMLIEKYLITGEGEFSIMYYPSIKTIDAQGMLIPNFRVTKSNLSSILEFYNTWKTTGLGVIN